MGSVELSVLKTELLNAIRAAESVETADQARKVYERYRAALQLARALGFRISAISFGSRHGPVDVRFERIPDMHEAA
jgi:cell division protein FtsX